MFDFCCVGFDFGVVLFEVCYCCVFFVYCLLCCVGEVGEVCGM